MTLKLKITLGLTITIPLMSAGVLNFVAQGPELKIRDWNAFEMSDKKIQGEIEIENSADRLPVNVKVSFYLLSKTSEGIIGCQLNKEYSSPSIHRGETLIVPMKPVVWDLPEYIPKWIVVRFSYEDSRIPMPLIRRIFRISKEFPFIAASLNTEFKLFEDDPPILLQLQTAMLNTNEC